MNSTPGLGTGYVLLNKKHAALKALFLPLLAIIMIQAYMTELIQDGNDGGIATFEDSDVILIYLVNGESELLLELR